jgi:hypothetical protein
MATKTVKQQPRERHDLRLDLAIVNVITADVHAYAKSHPETCIRGWVPRTPIVNALFAKSVGMQKNVYEMQYTPYKRITYILTYIRIY